MRMKSCGSCLPYSKCFVMEYKISSQVRSMRTGFLIRRENEKRSCVRRVNWKLTVGDQINMNTSKLLITRSFVKNGIESAFKTILLFLKKFIAVFSATFLLHTNRINDSRERMKLQIRFAAIREEWKKICTSLLSRIKYHRKHKLCNFSRYA